MNTNQNRTDEIPMPNTFKYGKTPEYWCNLLNEMHGLTMVPRYLRRIARQNGQFVLCGKDILLLPEHIDQLLNRSTTQPSGPEYTE